MLAKSLNDGETKRVFIFGGNPAYDAPADLKFGEALAKADLTAHVTTYKNETSLLCKWISAAAHPLAAWKDGKTFQGSTLIGQPLVNPLHGGMSELETLAALLGKEADKVKEENLGALQETLGQKLVRETAGFDKDSKEWKQAVHDGFVEEKAEPVEVSLAGSPTVEATDGWSTAWDESTFELVFKPSNSIYDGRFANNAWLQELPDFFTKIAWDNVAQVSPKTAKKLGVTQGGMGTSSSTQFITITIGEESEAIKVPIAIQPGQADGSIGLEIGFGRPNAGRVGGNLPAGIEVVGHDISPLRTSENFLVAPIEADAIRSTGTPYQLALVQEPWAIDSIARDEIQARMFRDASKTESKRSALIREGSHESFKEFHSKHKDLFENGGHAGDHKHDNANNTKPASNNAMLAGGALPILNQITPVSYTKPLEDGEDHGDKKHDDHGADGEHGHDAHGHDGSRRPLAFGVPFASRIV